MQNQPLPAHWQLANLGDISSDISYGYTASATSEPTGVRLLRITDIQNNTVNWPNVPNCKIEPEKIAKYRLKPRDLVFARTGATVGKSYLLKGDIPESVYASYLIRVRCLEGISTEFLASYFQSPYYWSQITDFSAGIGQPNVNGTKLKNLSVPVPPLAEQNVIADKLGTLLAQVENTKARLERIPQILKRFRQSVLAAAVSGRLTEEWRGEKPFDPEVKLLSETIENSQVGLVRSSKEQEKSQSEHHPTPYVKMNNINNDWGVSIDDLVYVSNDNTEFEKYKLQPDDWLFNTRNSSELVGKSCVWKETGEYVYNNNILRVRLVDGYLADYLEAWFRSPEGRASLERIKSATTNVAAIYQKQLLKQPVPFPDREEQTEIVRRIDQLFAHADRIEQQVTNALARVNNLTQSILAKAFRGELTEQWRKDNPELISGENSAEALLARIKAERAAAKPAKKARKRAPS